MARKKVESIENKETEILVSEKESVEVSEKEVEIAPDEIKETEVDSLKDFLNQEKKFYLVNKLKAPATVIFKDGEVLYLANQATSKKAYKKSDIAKVSDFSHVIYKEAN